ncbi:MAG: O-antigen ligase domain-containing protein [Candidatus Hydrogenedentota bacterium]|nr:MAG: O-antigen ligase domain-containing protein [Candidatus Hydrogenedentota bacterium]
MAASGGFFGRVNERKILTDFHPAVAAAAIFVLLLLRSLLPQTKDSPTNSLCFSRSFRKTLPDVTALILLSLLSLIHGSDISGAILFLLAAIGFLSGRFCKDRDAVRKGLLAGITLLSLQAFYQRWYLFPRLLPHLAGEAHGRIASGRVFASFITPGLFSAALATALPVAVSSHLTKKRSGTLLVMLLLLALALTKSFVGIVAAGVAILYLFGTPRALFSTILFFALLSLYPLATRPELHHLISSGNPVTLRFFTWKTTVIAGFEAPLFGHGGGSFALLYPNRIYSPPADLTLHPHNWPVLIFFEHGIFGLILWLLPLRHLTRAADDRSLRAAALAFLIASLVDIVSSSFTLVLLGYFLFGASLPESPTRKNVR